MRRESPGRSRRLVLWLGSPPDLPVQKEFENRKLILKVCPATVAPADWAGATGIVFRFDLEQPNAFEAQVRSLACQAANHGLLVVTLADDDRAFLAMGPILNKLELGFETIPALGPPAHEIPERIAREDPGPADPGEAAIEIRGEPVPNETRLFFRRAFWDCKTISIARLPGGRSADVFSVYPIFKDSLVGPRPLPLFAKVDVREKIRKEWDNYQTYVGRYVPFHARPNLEPDRCLVGASHGILVGDFVEQSESLWEVAKRGAAQPALYSLFDHALRGWRLQAYEQDQWPNVRPRMFVSLELLFNPTNPAFAKRERDATAFGAVRSLQEILSILKANDGINHRVAPQHGDLHVNNIRALRGEAILIDFNSARVDAPLVADPASLEVSLVFEVDPPDKNTDRVIIDNDNKEWRRLVENLYKPEYLHRAPPPPKEPGSREWMWACVRQVRLIALESQTQDNEYLFTLIFYLLRRASFQDETSPDKYRRDYAYYLASRLTDGLVSALGKSKEATGENRA